MAIFDEITATAASAKFKTGTLRRDGDKCYVYVQLSASAQGAAANGAVLYGTLGDRNVVTDDISTTGVNLVRGIAVGAIAKGSYGWIQTWGSHSVVKTDGGDDITTGDTVIGDTTADGVCDSIAKGSAITYRPIGFAYDADSDTADTVAVFVTLESGSN